MFDRTVVVGGGGPEHVTKTEHRAPTDESVRLLGEMGTEAEKQVLTAVMVAGNEVNATWVVSQNSAMRAVDIYCRLSINGEDRSFSFSLKPMEYVEIRGCGEHWQDAVGRLVFEKIVRELASYLHSDFFRSHGVELVKLVGGGV